MSVIEITHQDLSISQLRAEAARTAGAKKARRIVGIALALGGHSRRLAAQYGGRRRERRAPTSASTFGPAPGAWMAIRGGWPRRPGAWSGRRCATGCIA